MKILITTPFQVWPVDMGSARRTSNIVKTLRSLGHSVTLLSCGASGPDQEHQGFVWRSYPNKGRLGHFISNPFKKTFRSILQEQKPSLIIASFPFQSFMIVSAAKKEGIPVVYDAHNVECDRFKRTNRHPFISAAARISESHICRNSRVIFSVSHEDQELLLRNFGCDSLLLPNGVDLDHFKPMKKNPALEDLYGINGKQVVLYFGNFDYKPNREALRFMVNMIWPSVHQRIKDSVFLVVGKNPPAWSRKKSGIVVTGRVDDIVAHICLANVVAVPLMNGGGTRLKILEALACGQTVLSTAKGAEGIETTTDSGLMITSIENFSQDLIELLDSHPAPCANPASIQIAQQYTWAKHIGNIDWASLAKNSSPP